MVVRKSASEIPACHSRSASFAALAFRVGEHLCFEQREGLGSAMAATQLLQEAVKPP